MYRNLRPVVGGRRGGIFQMVAGKLVMPLTRNKTEPHARYRSFIPSGLGTRTEKANPGNS